MAKIYLLLLTIIGLLLFSIYKQSEVQELNSTISSLKKENCQYRKHLSDAQDKMNELKGQLNYLNVEAQSLRSDVEFIKVNPVSWAIEETQGYLQQLQSGIADAKTASE